VDDELNIDYADAESDDFERRTFTLLVSDDELDGIVERLNAERLPYSSERTRWATDSSTAAAGAAACFSTIRTATRSS